jgi:dihydrofolate reductase (trimethoprim resistance protein)
MSLKLIVARSLNNVIGNVIGNDSEIPWKVKGEQKLFKKITMDSVLIMGRKTYESIGRPLPGRITVVITRNSKLVIPGCEVVTSLEQAIEFATKTGKSIFVAGGGQIYTEALPLATELHLTTIQCEVEGNIHFPQFKDSEFKLLEEELFHSNVDYLYQHFQRI